LEGPVSTIAFPRCLDALEPGRENWLSVQAAIVAVVELRADQGHPLAILPSRYNRAMETIQQRLAEASQLHRSGHVADAEKIYREVLAENPGFPDALHLLGILAHQQGRLDEAGDLLMQAVETQPERPGFHIGLGRLLADRGQWGDAAAAFRRALSLQPKAAECCYLLGRVLVEDGKLEEAVRAFEACVRLAPHHLGAWNQLGRRLVELERFDAAIVAYQAIVAAKPDNRIGWQNLGNIQLHQRRFDEAESAFSRAVGIDPRVAEGWYGIGASRSGAGRSDAAAEALSEALQRDPDHVPSLLEMARLERDAGRFVEALRHLQHAEAQEEDNLSVQFELGATLYLLGRKEEATLALRRAIADPEHQVDAWRLLAQMRRIDAPGSEEESALRALLHREQLDDDKRAGLHFALGKICDERGDYQEAFASYAAANEIQLEKQRLDHDDLSGFVDAMIDAFPAPIFSNSEPGGSDSELPVFVLGMPRSGTTLAEQIIRAHPNADGVGEIKAMSEIFNQRFGDAGLRSQLAAAVAALTADDRAALATEYLQQIETIAAPGASRVVDKLPFNFNYIGFLRLLFPRARIVHCVRDPMDNCLSLFFGFFVTRAYVFNDLEDIGFVYAQYSRLMQHWNSCDIGPIHTLRYESLVGAPEKEVRSLLDFLQLDWDPGCLEFHEQGSAVKTLSAWQVREPIYSRSVGRWRNYEPWLEPLRVTLVKHGLAN